MPLTTAPSCDGGEFLVGDRNRPGQPDPRVIFAREIEIAGGLPDRVGRVLAGLQRVEIEDRLELDEGAAIGIGQRLVADEFAPGECRRAGCSARPRRSRRSALNGRAVLSSLTSPRLTPASPVSSAPVSPRMLGSPAMISISGAAGCELAGQLADLRLGQEQQPVLFEEFAGAERLNRVEMLGVAGQFLHRAPRSRRWSVPASAHPPPPGSCCRGRTPCRTGCRACASPAWAKSAC